MHVVVESPAKARTLREYLGAGHTVIATRGHVQDLAAKDGSVDPARGFAMVYATKRGATRALGAITAALADADALVLATDPDREGEAIAWQVLEWLREKDALEGKAVRRVVFHEITPEVVRALLALPRTVGTHPETGKDILAGIGRYGPWFKHGATYLPLPEDEDVLTVGLNRAVMLVDTA